MRPLHRSLIDRWFHELFTQPDCAVLDELVTEDFVTRDPSGKLGADSPAAFKKWLRWYHTSFTDAEWSILDLLSIDDKVVVRYAGKTTYTLHGHTPALTGGARAGV